MTNFFARWGNDLKCLSRCEIHPQNDRDIISLLARHFLETWYFSGSFSVNSPLSSGFFQKTALTHHPSFMMPAWGLQQLKTTRIKTYKHNTYLIRAFVQFAKNFTFKFGDVKQNLEPRVKWNSSNWQKNCYVELKKVYLLLYLSNTWKLMLPWPSAKS